jgi:predicted SnoaL-like aldol condensation-catalyzing enzyme
MTDDVRAIGQSMYAAFNDRDLAAAETIFSADFVSHALGTTGPEAVTRSWSRMIAACPDIQVVVEDMLVDGNRVAVRSTLRGLPVDAGEQRTPVMLEIFRVRQGRIAELWGLSTHTRPGR